MYQIVPFAAAWRTMQVGTREVADVILHPPFHGGTPDLDAALALWPGKWYWEDEARTRLVLVRPLAEVRPNWLWHGTLMALTVFCALGAGAILAGGYYPTGHPGLAGVFIAAGEVLRPDHSGRLVLPPHGVVLRDPVAPDPRDPRAGALPEPAVGMGSGSGFLPGSG